MRASLLLGLGLALALGVDAAAGQQQAHYFYDAHGRLVATTSASTGAGAGAYVRYGLDAAGNRTSVNASATAGRAANDRLQSGESLYPGQFLASADGRFIFVLQHDGHAVIYGPSGALWGTGIANGQGVVLQMQPDGNVGLRAPDWSVVWSTGSVSPGAALIMQSDGNLVVQNGWTVLWASGTGGH